jgi:hypothetical protein
MSVIYLATPYSRYPHGLDAAHIDACLVAASLISRGLSIYSPIAHTHPIAHHGGLDKMDHAMWLQFDEAMMTASYGLIVAQLPGWEDSRGIDHEIEFFTRAGKLIDWLTWPDGTFRLGAFDRLMKLDVK